MAERESEGRKAEDDQSKEALKKADTKQAETALRDRLSVALDRKIAGMAPAQGYKRLADAHLLPEGYPASWREVGKFLADKVAGKNEEEKQAIIEAAAADIRSAEEKLASGVPAEVQRKVDELIANDNPFEFVRAIKDLDEKTLQSLVNKLIELNNLNKLELIAAVSTNERICLGVIIVLTNFSQWSELGSVAQNSRLDSVGKAAVKVLENNRVTDVLKEVIGNSSYAVDEAAKEALDRLNASFEQPVSATAEPASPVEIAAEDAVAAAAAKPVAPIIDPEQPAEQPIVGSEQEEVVGAELPPEQKEIQLARFKVKQIASKFLHEDANGDKERRTRGAMVVDTVIERVVQTHSGFSLDQEIKLRNALANFHKDYHDRSDSYLLTSKDYDIDNPDNIGRERNLAETTYQISDETRKPEAVAYVLEIAKASNSVDITALVSFYADRVLKAVYKRYGQSATDKLTLRWNEELENGKVTLVHRLASLAGVQKLIEMGAITDEMLQAQVAAPTVPAVDSDPAAVAAAKPVAPVIDPEQPAEHPIVDSEQEKVDGAVLTPEQKEIQRARFKVKQIASKLLHESVGGDQDRRSRGAKAIRTVIDRVVETHPEFSEDQQNKLARALSTFDRDYHDRSDSYLLTSQDFDIDNPYNFGLERNLAETTYQISDETRKPEAVAYVLKIAKASNSVDTTALVSFYADRVLKAVYKWYGQSATDKPTLRWNEELENGKVTLVHRLASLAGVQKLIEIGAITDEMLQAQVAAPPVPAEDSDPAAASAAKIQRTVEKLVSLGDTEFVNAIKDLDESTLKILVDKLGEQREFDKLVVVAEVSENKVKNAVLLCLNRLALASDDAISQSALAALKQIRSYTGVDTPVVAAGGSNQRDVPGHLEGGLPQIDQGGGIEFGASLKELDASRLQVGDVIEVSFESERPRKRDLITLRVTEALENGFIKVITEDNEVVLINSFKVDKELPTYNSNNQLVEYLISKIDARKGKIKFIRVTRPGWKRQRVIDQTRGVLSKIKNRFAEPRHDVIEEKTDEGAAPEDGPDLDPAPPAQETTAPPVDSGVREVAEEPARAERASYPNYDRLVNEVKLEELDVSDVIHITSLDEQGRPTIDVFRVSAVDADATQEEQEVISVTVEPVDKPGFGGVWKKATRKIRGESEQIVWRVDDDSLKVGQTVKGVKSAVDYLMVAQEDKRQEFQRITEASQIEHDVLVEEIHIVNLRLGDYVYLGTEGNERYIFKINKLHDDGVDASCVFTNNTNFKDHNGSILFDHHFKDQQAGVLVKGHFCHVGNKQTHEVNSIMVSRTYDLSRHDSSADGAAAAAPTPEPAPEPVSAVAPAPEAAQPADVPETTSPSAEVKGFDYPDWEKKQDVVRKLRTLKVGDKLTWKLVGSNKTDKKDEIDEKEVTVQQLKIDKGFGELENFDPDKHNLEDAIAFFANDQRPLAISRLLDFAARGIITEVTMASERDISEVSGIVPISWPEESENKSSSSAEAGGDSKGKERAADYPRKRKFAGQSAQQAVAAPERPAGYELLPDYARNARGQIDAITEASPAVEKHSAKDIIFTYVNAISGDDREIDESELKQHLRNFAMMIQRATGIEGCFQTSTQFMQYISDQKSEVVAFLPERTPDNFAELIKFVPDNVKDLQQFSLIQLTHLFELYAILFGEDMDNHAEDSDADFANYTRYHREKLQLIVSAILYKQDKKE